MDLYILYPFFIYKLSFHYFSLNVLAYPSIFFVGVLFVYFSMRWSYDYTSTKVGADMTSNSW